MASGSTEERGSLGSRAVGLIDYLGERALFLMFICALYMLTAWVATGIINFFLSAFDIELEYSQVLFFIMGVGMVLDYRSSVFNNK